MKDYGRSLCGIVFDIKHGSVNDGPGIRTTVFLKGCFLSCLWCQNPESQNPEPQLMVYEEKCLTPKVCGELCRREVLRKVIKEKRNPGQEEMCPAEAAVITGIRMTVDEVLKEIEQYRNYYKDDGGITLCGGEPLYQPIFSLELLKGAKQGGIGTALYTCGHYPWDKVEPLLAWTDIVIFDIKTLDPEKHCQGTGVSNELILQNVKKLSEMNMRLWIRVPVIPSLNSAPDDIFRIVRFINNLKSVENFELLPYNSTGISKRKALGMKSPDKFFPPTPEQLSSLRAIASEIFRPARF